MQTSLILVIAGTLTVTVFVFLIIYSLFRAISAELEKAKIRRLHELERLRQQELERQRLYEEALAKQRAWEKHLWVDSSLLLKECLRVPV